MSGDEERESTPMSMESTAWNAMYTAMRAQTEQRPLNVGTLRRIGGFADLDGLEFVELYSTNLIRF